MGRIIQHSIQVYKFLKQTNLHTATIILSVVYSNKNGCFFLGAEVVNIVAALRTYLSLYSVDQKFEYDFKVHIA